MYLIDVCVSPKQAWRRWKLQENPLLLGMEKGETSSKTPLHQEQLSSSNGIGIVQLNLVISLYFL